VRGPQGPRLQEAALLAIGGHRLGRQEVELHHLHAGRGQRVLERAPRAALRHFDRRRARHVPQVGILRAARSLSPWCLCVKSASAGTYQVLTAVLPDINHVAHYSKPHSHLALDPSGIVDATHRTLSRQTRLA